jgi:hypothetical protein
LNIEEMNMNTYNQAQATHAPMSQFGRKLVCAIAACVLTAVLLGEVGKSPAQAAERAVAEQGFSPASVA